MAIIASGVNSGSGFGSSDAVTSTNLNNHVNDATFASGAVDEDTCTLTAGKIAVKAGSSSTGLAVGNFEHIATAKVLGRTTASTGAVELVDVVGTAGILKNDDSLGTSDTQGATQGNIKTYIDTGGFPVTAPSGTTMSTSGTVKLPGGIIMKFGTAVSSVDEVQTFTFPTQFPNACFSVVTNRTAGGTSKILPVTAISQTAFQIDRHNDINGSTSFHFIAIGN